MAEVTALRSNALPYPVRSCPYGLVFPILDADGDLVTGATGLDSEISKNGDTFADCTNEATEIATNSGMYYLLLTFSEMASDVVSILVKTSTSGAKTTPMVLYTRKLPVILSGTSAANSSDGTTITLSSSASTIDNYYVGCLIIATLDTTTIESRIITEYVGSTKVATLSVAFTISPDTDDTYNVLLPEGQRVNDGNTMAWNNTTVATPATAGIPDVNAKNWNNLATVELPLVPTTAGRKLDVSTTGEAGVDWANVGSPTTSLALTGTTISTSQVVASVTGAVGSVTGNVGGNVVGSVGSVVGAVGSVTGAVGSVTGNVGGNVVGTVASVVGNVGGNVTGSVGSIATGGIAAASFAAGAIDAAAIAANAIGASEIAAGAITSAKFAASAIDAAALATDAVNEIRDAIFARAFSAAYGSLTFDQVMSVILATQAAKTSGGATTTFTIRDLADGADVIVATVDASGNRTAVTVTP